MQCPPILPYLGSTLRPACLSPANVCFLALDLGRLTCAFPYNFIHVSSEALLSWELFLSIRVSLLQSQLVRLSHSSWCPVRLAQRKYLIDAGIELVISTSPGLDSIKTTGHGSQLPFWGARVIETYRLAHISPYSRGQWLLEKTHIVSHGLRRQLSIICLGTWKKGLNSSPVEGDTTSLFHRSFHGTNLYLAWGEFNRKFGDDASF